ncbi:MAG: hypothetical protein JWP58_391 [Hymenobacter sp.]|nr:hypothetical protein [Hymenobacter sp.]
MRLDRLASLCELFLQSAEIIHKYDDYACELFLHFVKIVHMFLRNVIS